MIPVHTHVKRNDENEVIIQVIEITEEMYETHEMAYSPGIELRVVRSRVVLQNLLCKHSDEFPPASLRNIKVNTEKLCHSVQKETTTGEDFRNGASHEIQCFKVLE